MRERERERERESTGGTERGGTGRIETGRDGTERDIVSAVPPTALNIQNDEVGLTNYVDSQIGSG